MITTSIPEKRRRAQNGGVKEVRVLEDLQRTERAVTKEIHGPKRGVFRMRRQTILSMARRRAVIFAAGGYEHKRFRPASPSPSRVRGDSSQEGEDVCPMFIERELLRAGDDDVEGARGGLRYQLIKKTKIGRDGPDHGCDFFLKEGNSSGFPTDKAVDAPPRAHESTAYGKSDESSSAGDEDGLLRRLLPGRRTLLLNTLRIERWIRMPLLVGSSRAIPTCHGSGFIYF